MKAKLLILSEGIKAIIANAEKVANAESIQPYCNKLAFEPLDDNGAEKVLKEYNKILNYELNIFLPYCLEIAKEYYPKLAGEYEECLITKLEFMTRLKYNMARGRLPDHQS